MKRKRRSPNGFLLVIGAFLLVMMFNGYTILHYDSSNTEVEAEAAIVLGAGTDNGKLSPVYRERMNHAIQLYKNQDVMYIICTGGVGEGQSISDSRAAMNYALNEGVPQEHLLIEEESEFTKENLLNAKELMLYQNMGSAVIISDPLHMKRAMYMCDHFKLFAVPSATTTSMYKSWNTKFKFLFNESFYLTIDQMRFIIPYKE